MSAPDPTEDSRSGPFRGAPFSPAMAMLADLMNNHLDPGYAAAARRKAENPPRTSRVRPALTVVTLLVIGLILALAYQQTVAREPDNAAARAGLVNDIRQRSDTTDQLERDAERLRQQLAAEREAALSDTSTGEQAAEKLRQLESITGFGAVTGPGVVVVVGDGPPPEDPVTGEPTGDPDLARVQDRDLQTISNALWAAGAEAIAINGQRLTSTSTIRLAGEAVLVDLRPITSPYTIQAIGDSEAMDAAFADSAVARRFRAYVQTYDMTFTTKTDDELTLPAASAGEIRFASPPSSPTPTPSATRGSASTSPTPPDTSSPQPVPSGDGGGR